MHKYVLMYAVLVLAFFVGPLPSRAVAPPGALIVIAHKSVSLTSISSEDLRPIFQTKTRTWPDGSPVRPFNLPPSHEARQTFDRVVLGLEPDLMPRYWIDRRVRGDTQPPNSAPTPALMVRVVASLAGAVGYVDAATTVDSSVKIIAKIANGQVTKP